MTVVSSPDRPVVVSCADKKTRREKGTREVKKVSRAKDYSVW